MRIKKIIFLFFTFATLFSFSQKSIGAKSFVKDKDVFIRWVPSDFSTLISCNEKGYSVKRISWDKEAIPDTSEFRNSSIIKNILSLRREDATWKSLIEKNVDAAFLYNVIYKQNDVSPEKSIMFFGLAMLSCDFDVNLAMTAGLFFKDEKPGEDSFAYLIQPNDSKLKKTIKPAILLVNPRKENLLGKIDSVKAVLRQKEVKLVWNIEKLKASYTGYFIERSEDGKNYKQLNMKPHILIKTQYEKEKREISFNDTLTEYNKTYFYRVKGLGFFGSFGEYSNPIKVKLVKPLNSYAIIDSAQLIKDSLFRIFWHNLSEIKPGELAGYAIYRAKKDDGPYIRLNKKLIRGEFSFLDEKPLKSSYYKICTFNVYGDSIISHPHMALIPDKSPPKTPIGLTGKIDSLGKVTLHWRSNKENDLMGYRIFRNNAEDEEPVEITRIIWKDTLYKDSVDINTLTENVFYFITAVDEVYNNSQYSKPVKLKRPDKIKPVSVVFTDIHHNDTMVILRWVPSTSTDVVSYQLFRNSKNELKKMDEWKVKDSITLYNDKTVEYGNYYQYQIRVNDDDGNFSETISPSHFYDSRIRKAISKVDYMVDRQMKSITLKWDYPEKDIYNFVLYRAKKGEEFRALRTLKSQVNSYEDKELYIGNIYLYKIKANFNSGAESLLSKEIEIVY